MGRAARHDILFEPIALGPKRLKNRFYQVPYSPGFGTGRPLGRAYHRGVAAEGGWAAVNTGAVSISRDWDLSPTRHETLWDDRDAESFAEMCRMVHAHGALAGIELAHGGAWTANNESRLPPLAPSQLSNLSHPHLTPKAMEQSDIENVISSWATAAHRAVEIGFDIIYVYGSDSYLPAQFLSPYHNQRTDAYGGSLANRARFWLEALERVRETTAGRCAVGTRIAATGLDEQGITLDETLQFIEIADHLVDFWDVNVSSDWARDSGSSRFFPEGHQTEWSGEVHRATTKPVIGVGRLTDPDSMAAILRSGQWDVIGAARPRIADPFLPLKVEQGRYDEIRECTGSNLCIWSRGQNNLTCLQNPTVGEEYRRGWHPERVEPTPARNYDVLVVGGGPAGMECALTLARRAVRRVHLVDGGEALGGSLSWVSRLPGLGEWRRVIDHRAVMLGKHRNAEVILGTYLGSRAVLEYGAEIVVIATGSRWATDGTNAVTHQAIPGTKESPGFVLGPEDVVVDGRRPAGTRVLVYDVDGYFMAPGVAELLQTEGCQVTLVTPFDRVSPCSDETLEGRLLRESLAQRGVKTMTATQLTSVAAPEVTLARGTATYTESFDGVVLVTQRFATDELYLTLKELGADRLAEAGIMEVHRVGDCVAPRLYSDAVFDGHRLGRGIQAGTGGVLVAPRREEVYVAGTAT